MKRTLVLTLATATAFAFGLADANAGCGTCDKTVVEVAQKTEGFKTLVAAVTAADLAKVLSGDGPFTVFAPSDDAFAKLPKGTLEDLLKPENKDKLISILKYHVVSGKVMAKDVVKLKEAKTVQGSSVKVNVVEGSLFLHELDGPMDDRFDRSDPSVGLPLS